MKNKRAILMMFLANSISGFAQGISIIAIPWYFANIINEPTLFGYIYLGTTSISLVWVLYAGTLIDKYNRKHIFLAESIAGFIVIGLISATGFWLGEVPVWLVATAFIATMVIFSIHYPNLYSFAQEISEAKDYTRVTSYIEIQGQLTTALAGAMAAILLVGSQDGILNLFGLMVPVGFSIVPWELHDIFLLNTITYVLAFGVVTMISFVPIQHREPDYTGIKARVKTGFSFLKKNPLIILFGAASVSIFITVLISEFYLLPIYIKNHLGGEADVYGSASMYFALGAVMAGLSIRYIFKNTSSVAAVIILSVLASVIFMISVFNLNIPFFYFIYFLLGLCNAGTRILRMVYFFNHIPNRIIGRAGSIFNIYSVLVRMLFIFIFSLPFFMVGNRVIIAFATFSVFIVAAAVVLSVFYQRLKDQKITEV